MDAATFNRIRRLVYERSGISLRDGKEALVSARIAKRMRALGLSEANAYLRHVLRDPTGEEVVALIDAISTNVTGFYREPDHFEFLGRALAGWLAQGQRRFRFWSAACATGEEPYSMAMTTLEAVQAVSPLDVRILATDISTRALQICRGGNYEKDKVGSVLPTLRNRYFDREGSRAAPTYRVKDSVKKLIVFRRLNLAETPYPMKGPLDLVFCRNVIIYFDDDVTGRLLAEVHRLLRPGGYLVAGHAESMSCMGAGFKTVQPSIYMKQA